MTCPFCFMFGIGEGSKSREVCCHLCVLCFNAFVVVFFLRVPFTPMHLNVWFMF